MLPNSHYTPARNVEVLINLDIPGAIPSELGLPIVGVRLRFGAVDWTTMPEAPINKDRETMSWKDDIRPDDQPARIDGEVLPEAQPKSMEFHSESDFGSRVHLAVGSHDRRDGWRGGVRVCAGGNRGASVSHSLHLMRVRRSPN